MAKRIVITSGKGGVGKSTLTAGLSRALSERSLRVLAIDCDIGLRSLDILLGHSSDVVFNWGDLLSGRCDAEQAIIKGDADLLAAPSAFDDSFTEKAFGEMIGSLSDSYDYILLDSPAGIDRGFRIAAAGAESALTVTTPDSVCVRSCSRAFSELDKCGIGDIRLIINMFDPRSVCRGRLLNIDECIDETGVQLLGIVPLDRELSFCSVTGDEPDEFALSTLAFERIAARLEGEDVKLLYR